MLNLKVFPLIFKPGQNRGVPGDNRIVGEFADGFALEIMGDNLPVPRRQFRSEVRASARVVQGVVRLVDLGAIPARRGRIPFVPGNG